MGMENLSWTLGQMSQANQQPAGAPIGSSGNLGFLSNVADAIPAIIGQFNYKGQANQLAIAEANARAAEAQAQSTAAQPKSNTIIWVVVIIAILILAALLIFKKK